MALFRRYCPFFLGDRFSMLTANQIFSGKSAANALTMCPHPVGTFSGVYQDLAKAKNIGIRRVIPCGSWSCPYCRKRNLKRLQYRIFNGEISKNLLNIYAQKFLTLTCGGREYRDTHTEIEAYEDMQKCFHKLIRALKKRFGDFFYLKVTEKHKDGYPHMHILLSGRSVMPQTILEAIEKLWRYKYGLGFVKLVVIRKGFRAGIKYITKYLVKDLDNSTPGIQSMGRYKRIFSASKGALMRMETKSIDWLAHEMKVGYVGSNSDGKTRVYEQDLIVLERGFKNSHAAEKENHAKLQAFRDFVLDNFFTERKGV